MYKDTACSPAFVDRTTPNTVVSCYRRQFNGVTPKLNDTKLGPENGLPNATTDVAYTLAGNSPAGFETWIVFKFIGRVSLSHVTLHYYCTGTPPQLQLMDTGTIIIPSCGGTGTPTLPDIQHEPCCQACYFQSEEQWRATSISLKSSSSMSQHQIQVLTLYLQDIIYSNIWDIAMCQKKIGNSGEIIIN